MPKPTKGPRIGGSPAHERIIMANLASQLFEHGRITTTETRARRVQPLAEKLISKAKRGDLHSRRLVNATITDKGVVHVLFTEIAPKLADREGGYTRITKIGNRKGDNAPMAVIEVVTEAVKPKTTKAAAKPAAKATAKPAKDEALQADGTFPTVDEAVEGVQDTTGEAAAVKDYGVNSFRGEEPPAGFDIKGNEDSMLYHTPESPFYEATKAEIWFNSPEAAEEAGFALPPSLAAKAEAAAEEAAADEADKA